MLTIYMSCPMDCVNEMLTLKTYILQQVQLPKESKDELKIVVPILYEDAFDHEYVYQDIFYLRQSDILIIHQPRPSIGSSCELGYFKALNPHNPVIAYKSIEHGWLKKLSDFWVDSMINIVKIIKTFMALRT